MKSIKQLKSYAHKLKQDIFALYLSYKDPRTPWYAKVFTICVVAYAFSPIDLIPDFIPIIGYLDDLILLPLGISIALKLIPAVVLAESREKAKTLNKNKQQNWYTGALFILIWVLLLTWCIKLVIDYLKWSS